MSGNESQAGPASGERDAEAGAESAAPGADAPETPGPDADGSSGAPPAPSPRAAVLRGTTVSPGLVLGHVHRKDYDLLRVSSERIARDELDQELNRFRQGLEESRRQLVDLRSRLKGRVHEQDARILDTHLAYLKDSVFIADVENLILNEQMRLEAAIVKVIADFDRIFRLVENATLRQSAVDLRDVGIRVLRNLERLAAVEPELEAGEGASPHDYVLVARELSIVDMFNLSNEHVKGIATREGGLTSHAAIFARSMGIPTVTGVEDLLERVEEGDFVILDATEGVLRVEPDELLRAQYLGAAAAAEEASQGPAWDGVAPDVGGEEVRVLGSAGNLPEVEQAVRLGMNEIGVYRTELLYLIDPAPPSREALHQHYATVLARADGRPVTFRLLNVDSSLGLGYMHDAREANPALGRVGVRALLAREKVLRRQLQALLLAAGRGTLRISVPFVNDCGELRRVKEVLFEERIELRREGETIPEEVSIGVVVETPAAMLGLRDLADEADFLQLNLDALQQYLLAVDRDNAELSRQLDAPHPAVLRALAKAARIALERDRPLDVFGVSAARPESLPLFFAVGLRRFCVAPVALRGVLAALREIDPEKAAAASRAALQSSCPNEASSLVAEYRHGYARP